jgi:alpha-D-xyloside xylohydrolase
MRTAHEKGLPPMRPLFFDYPDDAEAWKSEDQFLFCDSLLVAPILDAGARSRSVYLPKGRWKSIHGGASMEGGRIVECEAPLEWIPVFERE